MPFEDPGLWATRNEWPHAPLNFVFLLEAVVRVARAMSESDWSAQFVPADDPENFARVIRRIGGACEAEELRSFYRRPIGEIEPMDPVDWQWTSQEIPKAWQIFFHSGQLLENDLELLAEQSPLASSITRPLGVCWIFVRRGDLIRFLHTIRPKRIKSRRTSDVEVFTWARTYIKSLPPGQNPNEKTMWAAAKVQLPGAAHKQVMAAKVAVIGKVGRGRIKSKGEIQK